MRRLSSGEQAVLTILAALLTWALVLIILERLSW